MYNTGLLHEMIHPVYKLFLAIYLAHLLTDFVFQTSQIVSNKHRGEWRGYLIHGITHYAAVLAIVEIRRLRALGMSLSDIAEARRDGRDSTSLIDRLQQL